MWTIIAKVAVDCVLHILEWACIGPMREGSTAGWGIVWGGKIFFVSGHGEAARRDYRFLRQI